MSSFVSAAKAGSRGYFNWRERWGGVYLSFPFLSGRRQVQGEDAGKQQLLPCLGEHRVGVNSLPGVYRDLFSVHFQGGCVSPSRLLFCKEDVRSQDCGVLGIAICHWLAS